MRAWTLFIGLIPCALTQDPWEAAMRTGFLPFAAIQSLFGTPESPYGAFRLPVDGQLISLFAQPPFLSRDEFPARDGSVCAEFRKRQRKAALFERRVQQKKANLGPAQPDFLSLIDDPQEMANFSPDDFYCLFYLGYEPPIIPLGLAYGRVYYALGNPLINDLGAIWWGGKIVVEIPCESTGKKETVCLNQSGRFPVGWTHLSLGKEPAYRTPKYRNPEEALSDDNDGFLWVDYGAPFHKICPASVSRFYDAPPGRTNGLMNLVGGPGALFPPNQVSMGVLENAWPVTQMLDTTRWVGRDEKNKIDLYLGRAMFCFQEGCRVVSWFNLKAGGLFEGKNIIH